MLSDDCCYSGVKFRWGSRRELPKFALITSVGEDLWDRFFDAVQLVEIFTFIYRVHFALAFSSKIQLATTKSVIDKTHKTCRLGTQVCCLSAILRHCYLGSGSLSVFLFVSVHLYVNVC